MLLSHATLREHAVYVGDEVRMAAYEHALRAVVRPGDRVLDLGAGTGVLGLLALRAGAARVYVVDDGPMLEVARALHAAHGTTERSVFVRGHSRHVALPERVDLVVGDQVGYLGHGAGLLESYADAAERHLAPGGRLVPASIELWVAPAQIEPLREELELWSSRPLGLDLSSVRPLIRAAGDVPVAPPDLELLGPGVSLATLDLAQAGERTLGAQAHLDVTRAGRLDAIAGWFVAHLAPGVTMTNHPHAQERIDRPCGALPLDPAPTVGASERLAFTFRMDPRSRVRQWSVAAGAGTPRAWERRHSSLDGLVLAPGELARALPTHRPRLSALGQAQAALLALADGSRDLESIARVLVRDHAALFPTLAAGLDYVRSTLEPLESDPPNPTTGGAGGAA